MRGCKSTFRRRRKCRGRPKYFLGKVATFAGKADKRSGRSISSQRMGKTSVLDMLVTRPLAFPKQSRIAAMTYSSSFSGFPKIPTLSAYRDILQRVARDLIGARIPLWVANSRRRCKGSMARMNNMGERGSP
jgi:hypothetical protein